MGWVAHGQIALMAIREIDVEGVAFRATAASERSIGLLGLA